MTHKTIGIFIGSLRKGSYSRKIADNIIKMAPDGFEFKIVEIGHLPFYNQDFDDNHNDPASFVDFRQEVSALDGFLFVTPEYNRSIPAILKNAIDIASRPYGKNVWNGKPGAVISNSIGPIGGFGSNHHLRQVLTFVNVLTMQQPEAYLNGMSDESFDENGDFSTSRTHDFVQKFVNAFVAWIERLSQ